MMDPRLTLKPLKSVAEGEKIAANNDKSGIPRPVEPPTYPSVDRLVLVPPMPVCVEQMLRRAIDKVGTTSTLWQQY